MILFTVEMSQNENFEKFASLTVSQQKFRTRASFALLKGKPDITHPIFPNLPISSAILRFAAFILPVPKSVYEPISPKLCGRLSFILNYSECVINDVIFEDWISKSSLSEFSLIVFGGILVSIYFTILLYLNILWNSL